MHILAKKVDLKKAKAYKKKRSISQGSSVVINKDYTNMLEGELLFFAGG
jgi:hypothetical protein